MMELMTEPLPETPAKAISAAALSKALKLVRGKDALLVGPGISTNEETAEFLSRLMPRLKLPVVVDADGLNILSLKPELLSILPKPAILTPHPGEFARLIGSSAAEVIRGKLELVPAFAQKHGLYLILKGYRTLIAGPDGRVYVNPTGNPGMATGGTGDVLSGMIGSFLMQDKNPLRAALAAVYLHGLSGDLAARKTGERGLVAGDLIRFLPRAVHELEEHDEEETDACSI
jgi:NAD(P)H-hydrate epimerase